MSSTPRSPAIFPVHALATALLIGGLVLTTACGSLGGIDLEDILGSTGPGVSSDIEGTVTQVDTRDRRIDLDVYQVNDLRERHSDRSIYYDADTVVLYQGETYRPEDLERGDEIDVLRNLRR